MKNKQGITIAALIIAIVGLSIGFAAFSNTLNISSSATVTPDENTFNVVFSSSSSGVATDSVVPAKNTAASEANISTTNGTISGRSLTNLSAEFTAPGQSVTYETNLYVYNAGQLQAQLTGIVFNNATGFEQGETATYKRCVASQVQNEGEEATPSLVEAACNGISISVTVGTANDVTPSTTGDKAALNYQMLGAGESLPVSVTISYADGSAYVDGPMEVSFGRIDINATSAIDPTQEVVPVNYWVEEGLTSPNVVFNKTYQKISGYADSAPDTIVLNSTGTFVAEGDVIANVSTNYSGVDIGTNYLLVDVDELMGTNYELCQLYLFDGVGTMSFYQSFGSACSYTTLIAGSPVTYSAN